MKDIVFFLLTEKLSVLYLKKTLYSTSRRIFSPKNEFCFSINEYRSYLSFFLKVYCGIIFLYFHISIMKDKKNKKDMNFLRILSYDIPKMYIYILS